MTVKWEAATVEREWDDGYKMVRIRTKADMKTLTDNGGGCAQHHYFWTDVVSPVSEYFFVLMKPDGGVGPILFCKRASLCGKKHPKEDAQFDEWYREHGMGYRITSDYYDRHVDSIEGYKNYRGRNNYQIEDAQYYLREAQDEYEAIKARALAAGPLGKDNPYKVDLDAANKHVTSCKGKLDKLMATQVVTAGDTFTYKRTKLFIVEIAGRGVNYDGSNTRYTEKIAQFIGKE